MTIVECFEKAPIENMISALTARPERLIFIGKESQMDASIKVYRQFLKNKGIDTEIITRDIDKNDLGNIVGVLTDIVTAEKDCIIDITGGEDMVLLAVGIVFEKYRSTHSVKLQRFNILNGKIIDCDGDNEVSFEGAFSLTVNELISLYGGVVVPETPQPAEYLSAFDIKALWEAVCEDPKEWNRSVGILREFEAHAEKKDLIDPNERMEYELDLNDLSSEIVDYQTKFDTYYSLITKLLLNNMVTDFSMKGSRFSYRYRDRLIRRCLNKAGDVLEMKTYFEARDLEVNGERFFSDCYVSVKIDWDGVLHQITDDIKDTRNEIDVILMHGLTPVFISCKNGAVEENELYKLNTVAERFGGKYARKVLIATNFQRDNLSSETAFKQRAKDMNILFIEDAQRLSDREWKEKLVDIVKDPMSLLSEADRAVLT